MRMMVSMLPQAERIKLVNNDLTRADELIKAVPAVYIACIQANSGAADRPIDWAEMMMPRFSLRFLYHARNFISILEEFTETHVVGQDFSGPVSLKIGNEIYFEFDAFLYSAKSYFEKNTVSRGYQFFTGNRLTSFESIVSSAHDGFLTNFVKPFRDEAVHLNGVGTSVSQMLSVAQKDDGIELALDSTFVARGQKVNLVEAFLHLAYYAAETASRIAYLLMGQVATLAGPPDNMDVSINMGTNAFTIRELVREADDEA